MVTNEEFERIKKLSNNQGYKSISHYLRDLSLNKEVFFKDKLQEIYNMVKNN